MKIKGGTFKDRLAGLFELPREIVMDVPRITMIGNLQVTVENHRGVIEYSPERCVIGIHNGQMTIQGRDLVIGIIYEDEITVTGFIGAVQFSA